MKKVLIAVSAVLLVGAIFFASVAADFLYGDATGDGVVNGRDLIRLRKYLNGEDVVLGPEKCEEHTFGEWYVTLEPTCTKAGIIKRKCANCDEIEEDTTPALGHEFGEDGVCIRCGEVEPVEPTPDEYFIFTLLDDGTYEIGAKDVNDMPAKVLIPATHDGLPVSRIAEHGFENCAFITNIFFSYNVSSIGNFAFSGCYDLRKLVIPDGIAGIGEDAFAHCYGLKSISVPDSVTDIGTGAFQDCTVLESITVSEGNPSYYSMNNCLMEKESNILIAGCKMSIIPAGVAGIGDAAFYGCAELKDIEIPDGVTFIGDSAFSECVGLTEITLPDSVTSIGDFAFAGCVGLTSVTTGSGVTSIGEYVFSCCVGLTSITIPDSATRIGVHAFDGCSGLTSVTIGSGVTNIDDGVFYCCFGLTSITIPDGVTYIGDRAFSYCYGLTSITIGNGITAIGTYALCNCKNLADICYNGTEEQWGAVEKGEGWDKDAGEYTVHCTDGDIPKR